MRYADRLQDRRNWRKSALWCIENQFFNHKTHFKMWVQRKRQRMLHISLSPPFSSHQQAMSLGTQKQHHWVMHWNQTQHSLNSIWIVKTKERRHTKDIHQQFTLFISLHNNRQLYWWNRSNIIEWSTEIKQNTHCTQSKWLKNKRKKTRKASINN